MLMESSINSATILPPYEEEFEPVDNLHWSQETANSIYLFWIRQLQASTIKNWCLKLNNPTVILTVQLPTNGRFSPVAVTKSSGTASIKLSIANMFVKEVLAVGYDCLCSQGKNVGNPNSDTNVTNPKNLSG
ncbi:hypothetical protein LOTGIDRAFT_157182 [Lottia gigantea]|uniref:Uncharacterized protein n=1 Tax=Lottia gigantea TaxID=225164 RepID=V4B8G1_LOTGI|nr:hypothetical protein LOTGIDRAFT_157182 [Lottia gigantea]ESP02042.1 hypothetical protein LOTGIDRAFT_157182 [Lottia gigantea]